MKKIAVLTSGEMHQEMNAAIRSVRTAIHNGIEVMGVQRGCRDLSTENYSAWIEIQYLI